MRYIAPQVNNTVKAIASIHGQNPSKAAPLTEDGLPTNNAAYEADE